MSNGKEMFDSVNNAMKTLENIRPSDFVVLISSATVKIMATLTVLKYLIISNFLFFETGYGSTSVIREMSN